MSESLGVWLGRYAGESLWLVCGGPSVRGFDFTRLHGTTAAINEMGLEFASDLWFGHDRPELYPAEFWESDTVKFMAKGRWRGNAANLVEYEENTMSQFLDVGEWFDDRRVTNRAPAIGANGQRRVKPSTMLAAMGVIVRLGFSEIRLLGCDFEMCDGEEYGHDRKEIGEHLAKMSNERFDMLIQWFEILAPELKKRGVRVVNCTPGGRLDVFERACLG